MDLGIPKCAVTGCPNKSKLHPTTFKALLQATNINYRNQPIPALNQHESYTYLEINLRHLNGKHKLIPLQLK